MGVNGKEMMNFDELLTPTMSESLPTLVDVRKLVPNHCLSPDSKRATLYLFKDLALMLGLYLVLLLLERQPYIFLYYAYLPLYISMQSVVMTALFLIGHDCGHESFSANRLYNDAIGTMLLSSLFLPYFWYKRFHLFHHKNTNNIDERDVYCLERKKAIKEGAQHPASPLPYFGLALGWFFYFLVGPLVTGRDVGLYLMSTVSLVAWTSLVIVPYLFCFGWKALLLHYLLPLFGCGSMCIMIFFLHHVDERVPWYGQQKWHEVRGRLCAIDRDYGILHNILHNVGTHQIHHLLPKIPHYHLEEATEYFRAKYPELVHFSDEQVFLAFQRLYWVFKEQSVIDDDAQIHFFGKHKETKNEKQKLGF